MKVALCGVQNSGKTTLLNMLKEVFKDAYFFSSPSRKACDAGFGVNENSNEDSQNFIMNDFEKNLSIDTKLSFFDRCPLDAFSYAQNLFENKKISKEYLEQYKQRMLSNIKKFNIIFILDPIKNIEDNGVRNTDPLFQMKMHKIFMNNAKKYRIKTVYLKGNIDERINIIKGYLK